MLNTIKSTSSEVAEKLKKIPIIHLYGKLGMLPWEIIKKDDYSRNYNSEISPPILRRSSKSLKIIHDQVLPDNEDFRQARKILGNARRIYFLGFGYHTENLDRLKIRSLTSSTIGTTNITTTPLISKIIEGTSFGLLHNLKDNIPKNYKIKLPNHEWDINDFFEQRIRLD